MHEHLLSKKTPENWSFIYKWWAWLGLNQRPIGYEPTALTTELQARKYCKWGGVRTPNFVRKSYLIPYMIPCPKKQWRWVGIRSSRLLRKLPETARPRKSNSIDFLSLSLGTLFESQILCENHILFHI